MGTLPTALLQIICENILNFQVTVKCITDPDGNFKRNAEVSMLGLGIGFNFMIDNRLQPIDRLSIIISSSHFCSNWVLEV